MRPLHANLRIVVLSAAALLLGSWNLIWLSSGPASDPLPSGPVLEPELVGTHAPRSDARPDTRLDAPRADAQGVQTSLQAPPSVPIQALAPVGDDPGPQPAVQERPDAAFCQLLDQVFGPERFVRDPTAEASPASPGKETDAAGRAAYSTAQGPGMDPANPDAGKPAAQRRPRTEKAFYEGFVTLARKDPQELLRQADAILGGDAENFQKVAMLRALYDTDRARALAYFTQAISRQPDVSRPEAVSIPVFAVDFLSKRLADPGVKTVMEAVAMSGNITVSPGLQRLAAEALFAKATPADLQRYASSPVFQAAAAATPAAGSEAAP